jgi:hypothetical protein
MPARPKQWRLARNRFDTLRPRCLLIDDARLHIIISSILDAS